MSNFKELENGFGDQRAAFHLHDIHEKLGNQQGMFRLFADVAELFLPQTINTFFKMVGSNEDVVKPRQAPPDFLKIQGTSPADGVEMRLENPRTGLRKPCRNNQNDWKF